MLFWYFLIVFKQLCNVFKHIWLLKRFFRCFIQLKHQYIKNSFYFRNPSQKWIYRGSFSIVGREKWRQHRMLLNQGNKAECVNAPVKGNLMKGALISSLKVPLFAHWRYPSNLACLSLALLDLSPNIWQMFNVRN